MTGPPETVRVNLMKIALRWWRGHVQGQNCLEGFSPEQIGDVSRAQGLSEDDLIALGEAGPEGAILMTRMMKVMGLDIDDLRQTYPLVVKDIEVHCTWCESNAGCRRDLDWGTVLRHMDSYRAEVETEIR